MDRIPFLKISELEQQLLVKAVQELSKQNEGLKKQNEELLRRIEKLELVGIKKDN